MESMNTGRRQGMKFNTKEILFISSIVLFAGIIRIPSLSQPMGPDQGIMSVIGEGILNGGLPYRDYWEMGSPPIFFTYALMFKLFGNSMATIPVVDMMVSMLTTFLVFLLARLIWDNKAGYVSALLFALFSNGVRFGLHSGGDIAFGTFWYIAQRETFMLPLMTASMYFLLRAQGDGWKFGRLMVSGLLAGLTFAYKFPSLLIFMCLILYVNGTFLFSGEERKVKKLVADNVALISGFVLALVPFVLFFTIKGVMPEMIDVIFGFVSSVYGQTQHDYWHIIKLGLSRSLFIARENFILWIFFVTSSIYILVNERTKENFLMVLWATAAILFVVSHREFFGYHFLVILPPFSVLAGYGMVRALGPQFKFRRIFTEEFGKAFIVLALIINLVFFASLDYMHYTKFFYYATGRISKETYYGFFSAYPKHEYSFPADYQVAQYIIKNTAKDDMIYALGGVESVVYFLSKRKSPSRFIFSWIILSGVHGSVDRAARYRAELLNDLMNKTPKYILTVKSLDSYGKFTGIYNFIENNYALEKVFPDDRFLYVFNGTNAKKI
jgi:hypothetical protein